MIRLYNRIVYSRPFFLALALVGLLTGTGCATKPELPAAVVVEGNGKCHPSSDLPPHKKMKKVPVAETGLQKLFDLFLGERKDHAKDVQDYNSLYDICVNGKTTDK